MVLSEQDSIVSTRRQSVYFRLTVTIALSFLFLSCGGSENTSSDKGTVTKEAVEKKAPEKKVEYSKLCSYNGVKTPEGCDCKPGYTGFNCAGKSCPNNCSERGICNKGKCFCIRGASGEDCSKG